LLARSLARAVRFVPALADALLVRTWAGLRPWTPDRLPLVGPVPGRAGLFLASGHEGLGLTLAPLTGEIVAGTLCGEPLVPDAVALLPGRFALRLVS
jgi:glycine/D-amino acid oxidase-like deaminating enzyme